jgi:hypothetical protein
VSWRRCCATTRLAAAEAPPCQQSSAAHALQLRQLVTPTSYFTWKTTAPLVQGTRCTTVTGNIPYTMDTFAWPGLITKIALPELSDARNNAVMLV